MKQLVLALVLIAVPVGLFAAYESEFGPAEPATPAGAPSPLGEMADLRGIAEDTGTLVSTGDLAGAKARITEFETAWDDQEATLRPKAPEDWGRVDAAADEAISALRARAPEKTAAGEAVAGLIAALANPSAGDIAAGGVQSVAGIAVTDALGHAIPCEDLLKQANQELGNGTHSESGKAAANDLVVKATERCNADDDTRANAFSAQALAALAGN